MSLQEIIEDMRRTNPPPPCVMRSYLCTNAEARDQAVRELRAAVAAIIAAFEAVQQVESTCGGAIDGLPTEVKKLALLCDDDADDLSEETLLAVLLDAVDASAWRRNQ